MINIIGCGPGSEDYLTGIARSLMDCSDVLIGARRMLALARNSGAEKIVVAADIDKAIEATTSRHTGSNQVSVLVSGDPGLFSLARRVIERHGRENCRVVPGISSVQTAFARIGVSWQDAVIISAHHELPDLDSLDFESRPKIALLSGRDDVLDWLQQLVRRVGDDIAVFACENLTLEDEKITELAADDIGSRPFASRCVFLIVGKGEQL